MTAKESAEQAKKLGFEKTNYRAKNGEPIYYNKKTKTYINFRIHKEDWSNYDLTNDYSIRPADTYAPWDKADIFVKDEKVWGGELNPEEEEFIEWVEYADTTDERVQVQMYNENRNVSANSIAANFRIYNTSTEDIPLSSLNLIYSNFAHRF